MNLITLLKFCRVHSVPDNAILLNSIKNQFSIFYDYFRYEDIILFDTNALIRYSHKLKIHKLNDTLFSIFKEAKLSNKPVLSNTYYCNVCKEIHLDVILPVIDEGIVLGGIILRINPYDFLYPLIQTWPTASPSSETLLITKDGNKVVFLNELRHKKNTALKLKLEIDSENFNIPAVIALSCKRGLVEGLDYRGVPVLTDIREIPNSPWIMIAKVDLDEIYKPINERAIYISILGLLILVSFGIGLLWVWTNQKKTLRIQYLEDERKRRALIKHFDYIVKYSNDIYLLFDKELNIIEANERANIVYGYTKEEFTKLNIKNLRTPDTLPQLFEQIEQVNKQGESLYESVHLKKDGTSFPIEVSLRVVNIDENKYYQAIIRDITERKKALKLLKESEDKFKSVFDSANVGKSITTLDGVITVNKAFSDMLGYTMEEMQNKKWQELTPPEEIDDFQKILDKIFKGEIESARFNKNYIHKKGYKVWADVALVAKKDLLNKPLYLIVTVVDLSELKVTMEKLRKSEIMYRNLFEHILTGFSYCKMTFEGDYPKDFKLLKVNEAFGKLTGLKNAEGKFITEIVPGIRQLDDKIFDIYGRVALTGKSERFELYVESLKDWYDVSVYSPEKEYFICVFDVITERKVMEQALKDSEIKYKGLFNNSIIGIYRTTPDGRILECNDSLIRMLGYESFDELKKRNLEENGFEPEYPRSEFQKTILRDGEVKGLESAWKKKDGTTIYLRENAKLVKDKAGNILYYEGTIEDITKRKLIENELKISENKYRRLHESMVDGFVLVNMDGVIIECNESYRAMLGYSFDELKKITYQDITPEKWHEIETRIIKEKILSKGYSDIYEKEYRKKDGTIFPIEIRTFLLKSNSGENEGMWAIVRDITERKKAENDLKRYKELMDEMGRIANVGGWEFDPVTLKGTWTKEVAHIHDLDPKDETNAEKGMSFYIGDSKIKIEAAIKEAIEKGTPYDLELELISAKGRHKWVRTIGITEKSEGKVVKVKGSFQDITERKLADEILRENERKLREAQEMAHLGYWNWDVKTGEVEWSEEVYKIFKLDPKKFTPKIDSILELSPWPEDHQRDKELIQRAIENREPGFYEQKFLRSDNSIGYYSSTFQGKYNEKGELIAIVGSVMDITERKKAEEVIRKLNEELEHRVKERTAQLEHANKELEAFSYSVSHDLRAPLRSIDGFSLALFEDYYKNLDEKAKDYIDRIRNATTRMDELIDSMLKLSRVTRFDLKFEKVNLSDIANETVLKLVSSDTNRKSEFKIGKDIIAEGDKYLLGILLDNLLGNAWKFTSKKEKTVIELGTFIKDLDTVYFIRDNGTGFDMKYYDKLFGAFQRLHSKSDFPGTGIGLATVQRIVHRHNGNIWAESEMEKGTTFYFTLNKL